MVAAGQDQQTMLKFLSVEAKGLMFLAMKFCHVHWKRKSKPEKRERVWLLQVEVERLESSYNILEKKNHFVLKIKTVKRESNSFRCFVFNKSRSLYIKTKEWDEHTNVICRYSCKTLYSTCT